MHPVRSMILQIYHLGHLILAADTALSSRALIPRPNTPKPNRLDHATSIPLGIVRPTHSISTHIVSRDNEPSHILISHPVALGNLSAKNIDWISYLNPDHGFPGLEENELASQVILGDKSSRTSRLPCKKAVPNQGSPELVVLLL